jgi:hypothetical protein
MRIHPFQNAIEAILGSLPLMTGTDNYPLAQSLEDILVSKELPDQAISRLQDYCSLRANPAWATGESIIDAADLMVERAVENGNIKVIDEGSDRAIYFVNG